MSWYFNRRKGPKMYKNILISILAIYLAIPTLAAVNFEVQTLDDTLSGPWAVVTAPSGELYITEKRGKIFVYTNGQKTSQVEGLPSAINVTGQGRSTTYQKRKAPACHISRPICRLARKNRIGSFY